MTEIACLQNKLAIFQIKQNKLAVFHISSAQYFQYFSHSPSGSHVFHDEITYTDMRTVTVINYLRPPEPDQNMLYLSPYHWRV